MHTPNSVAMPRCSRTSSERYPKYAWLFYSEPLFLILLAQDLLTDWLGSMPQGHSCYHLVITGLTNVCCCILLLCMGFRHHTHVPILSRQVFIS